MPENLLNKKDNNLKMAEKYLGKYLFDLQKHFALSDYQLVKILNGNISRLKKKHKNMNFREKFFNIFKNSFSQTH